MKKARVDQDKCIGCGTCAALCPQGFKLGENGKAQALNPEGLAEDLVQTAIDSCPVQAIGWEEEA